MPRDINCYCESNSRQHCPVHRDAEPNTVKRGMTYRVECEFFSIPQCTEYGGTLHQFGRPQLAADFARQWVADHPLDLNALPRAKMYRNGANAKTGVILSVWRKPDGEICEKRLTSEVVPNGETHAG